MSFIRRNNTKEFLVSITFGNHTFFARAKKVSKKARPVKSHTPRSLLIFRGLQNSRNCVPLTHAALLHPKNPCARGAFQRKLKRIVHNPGITVLFYRTVKVLLTETTIILPDRSVFPNTFLRNVTKNIFVSSLTRLIREKILKRL